LSKLMAPPVQPDCVLTIGSQDLPAVLADEQATDLHVLIQGSPLFWVDDIGVLRNSVAETAVRVSNIIRMEESNDDFTGNISSFRIGLVRLASTAVKPRSPSVENPLSSTWAKGLTLLPLRRVTPSVGGLIGFILIVTPLIIAAVAWQHHIQSTRSAEPFHPAIDSSASPQSTTMTVNKPSVPVIPELARVLSQLPGVEPFLAPEVAKKLKFTPSQTGAFGRLDKTTREALDDLEKDWGSSGQWELARRRNVLFETARQEALQLLTDQQREQWDAMTR